MPAVKRALPVRHIPQRTCVGCRRATAKRGLVRVVRTPAGAVEVDASGKKPGRGAYVCPDAMCWERALKSGGLERALKTAIGAQDRQALLAFAAGLAPVGTREVG